MLRSGLGRTQCTGGGRDEVWVNARVEIFEEKWKSGVGQCRACEREHDPASHPHDGCRAALIVEGVVFVEQIEQLIRRKMLDVFAKVLFREFNHR